MEGSWEGSNISRFFGLRILSDSITGRTGRLLLLITPFNDDDARIGETTSGFDDAV